MNQSDDIRIEDFSALVYPAEEGGYWAEVPALPGCLPKARRLTRSPRTFKTPSKDG